MFYWRSRTNVMCSCIAFASSQVESIANDNNINKRWRMWMICHDNSLLLDSTRLCFFFLFHLFVVIASFTRQCKFLETLNWKSKAKKKKKSKWNTLIVICKSRKCSHRLGNERRADKKAENSLDHCDRQLWGALKSNKRRWRWSTTQ